MKREIKYRGRAIDGTCEWATGFYWMTAGRAYIGHPDMYYAEVDPDTVGQFTGLYDAEGRDVYEGDMMTDASSNFVIEWNQERMAWNGRGLRAKHPFSLYNIDVINAKIVGTIHDPKPA